MKKYLKRLTALVLAISMSLSLLSATTWAAEVIPQEEDSSTSITLEPQEEPEQEGQEVNSSDKEESEDQSALEEEAPEANHEDIPDESASQGESAPEEEETPQAEPKPDDSVPEEEGEGTETLPDPSSVLETQSISEDEEFFINKRFEAISGSDIISFSVNNDKVIATWESSQGFLTWPLYVIWTQNGQNFYQELSYINGYGIIPYDFLNSGIYGGSFQGYCRNDGIWEISIKDAMRRNLVSNNFSIITESGDGDEEDDGDADTFSKDSIPNYPLDGQDNWVIFKEGNRNNRVELSTFNLSFDTQKYARIIWDKGLIIQGSEIDGKCNQYYYRSNNTWEKIGTYDILTDCATEVIASNLDVYDKNGKLLLKKSQYNGTLNSVAGVYFLSEYNYNNGEVYLDDWCYRLTDTVDTTILNGLVNRNVYSEIQGDKVLRICELEEHFGMIQDFTVYDKDGMSFASSITISGNRYLTISEDVYNWINYDEYHAGDMVAFYLVDRKIVLLEKLNYRTGRLDTRELNGNEITIDSNKYTLSRSFVRPSARDLIDWEGKTIGYYIGSSKDPTAGSNVVFQIVGLVDNRASIKLYSSSPDLQVHVGESIEMIASLLINDGTDSSWSRPAFVVGNNSVISMSDYTSTSLGYKFEINGLKEGSSLLTITDSESGAHLTVNIDVVPSLEKVKNYSYKLDNVPSFYPDVFGDRQTLTNFYNFYEMYVKDYKTKAVENGTRVEFDVYNHNYMTGAVDVYNAQGKWIESKPIMKYTDISSLYETGKAAVYLVVDGIHNNFLSYMANSYSTKTHIDVVVPQGGYFTISNNFAVSPGVYLFNCVDYLIYSLDAVTTAFVDVADSETYLNVYDEFCDSLFDDRDFSVIDSFVEQMNSSVINAIGTTTTINLGDTMGVITDDFANIIESLGFSWKEMFQNSVGIGESAFEKLAGPPGVVLKGLFSFNKITSRLCQTNSLTHSFNRAYISVHSKASAVNSATVSGVTVSYNQGVIDDDTVLQVFRIGAPADTWFIHGEYTYPEQYTLYNISFVKNEQNVQPNGKVTVKIPIPEGMSSEKCLVFRQEEDGSWTEIVARVDGKYLVFETDHFCQFLIKKSQKSTDSPITVVASGQCGDKLTWTLDAHGTLIVSGTGEMYNGPDWDGWGEYYRDVKSIVIEEGATSVGQYVFNSFVALGEVRLPGTLREIGEGAFWYCNKLPQIIIPEGVTTIGAGAFDTCTNLRTIWIPFSVKTIGDGVFNMCCQDLMIYCKKGSCAEEFAINHCFSYVSEEQDDETQHSTHTHTWDTGTVATPATCMDKGVKTFTCSSCDETKTEDIPLDPNNHTGGTECRYYKPATCGADGYTGDTYCLGCKKKIATGKIIVATRKHKWDAGKVTKAATTSSTGVKTYTCTVCHQTKTEPIAKVVKSQNTITGKDTIFRTSNVKKNQTFTLGVSANGAPLSYKSSNRKVTVAGNGKVTIPKGFLGKVTITVTSAETQNYLPAEKKVTLMVGPSATTLSSVKWDAKKKVVNITWKKNTTGKGYEIQVSLKKDFKKLAKKVTVNKNATVKTAIKALKKGTYYVRIRTINGKTYSDWSKAKTVKITK